MKRAWEWMMGLISESGDSICKALNLAPGVRPVSAFPPLLAKMMRVRVCVCACTLIHQSFLCICCPCCTFLSISSSSSSSSSSSPSSWLFRNSSGGQRSSPLSTSPSVASTTMDGRRSFSLQQRSESDGSGKICEEIWDGRGGVKNHFSWIFFLNVTF